MRYKSKTLNLLVLTLLALFCSADIAVAGPLVAAAAALWASIGAAFTVANLVTFAVLTAVNIGLNYLVQALQGSPSAPTLNGIKGQIQTGADIPRSFIVGNYATAGSLVYVNTWGQADKTPNAYLTMVIALSDLPVNALNGLWVNSQQCDIDYDGILTDWGYPVTQFNSGGADYMWVKFYDGTQSSADSWLVSQFGSDPAYPYTSSRVGSGVAYAVVTCRLNNSLFSGFPQFIFEVQGINLYDQREDSTAGGSGLQRFSNQATWEWSDNPATVIHNILRGFTYNGQWVYGLQGLNAARLPADSWFAAQNECDRAVDAYGGGTEIQYRCGAEISVDLEPADVIESLLTACNGRIAEIGGDYKLVVGAAGSSVATISDDTIITTEPQSFIPFSGQQTLINGVTGRYPEPGQMWANTDAPARYNSTYEAEDGKRLVANVTYAVVPYLEQVQRLMLSALNEARKFRQHPLVLPPECWVLEPNDIITFNSTRNSYSGKLFRVDQVTDNDNLDVAVVLIEVDPADYDYDPDADYIAGVDGAISILPSHTITMTGWTASAVTLQGDNGTATPGIHVTWDIAGKDGVIGVAIQVRHAASGVLTNDVQSVADWTLGYANIGGNLLPNTEYEVRGRYIVNDVSGVVSSWSDWLDVTTGNVLIKFDAQIAYERAVDWPALSLRLENYQKFIGSQTQEVISQIDSLAQSVSELSYANARDIQTTRQEITSTYEISTAKFTEEITVATGPNSALVRRVTRLESALDGYLGADALASAVSALVTSIDANGDAIEINAASITTIKAALTGYLGANAVSNAITSLNTSISTTNGNVTANANAITSLNSTVGKFSASGLFRVSTNAALHGASATVAIAAAASSGGAAATAALYLSAMAGGTSEVIISADKIYMTDGTNFQKPFLFSGGVLYVDSAVIPNLDASKITTGYMRANSIITDSIVGGAITTTVIANSSGANISTSYSTVVSASITTIGGPLLVQFTDDWRKVVTGVELIEYYITVDTLSITMRDTTNNEDPSYGPICYTNLYPLSAGTYTVTVQARKTTVSGVGATCTSMGATLILTELKR